MTQPGLARGQQTPTPPLCPRGSVSNGLARVPRTRDSTSQATFCCAPYRRPMRCCRALLADHRLSGLDKLCHQLFAVKLGALLAASALTVLWRCPRRLSLKAAHVAQGPRLVSSSPVLFVCSRALWPRLSLGVRQICSAVLGSSAPLQPFVWPLRARCILTCERSEWAICLNEHVPETARLQGLTPRDTGTMRLPPTPRGMHWKGGRYPPSPGYPACA